MAYADWTPLADALTTATVKSGASAGFVTPNGGGSFCYAMNSIATAPGVLALYTNQASFAPAAAGGSVTGCVQRGITGATTGFAPFLFACLQGTASTGTAYMLGLSDGPQSFIELRKGTLLTGMPAIAQLQAPSSNPANSGVLCRGSVGYPVAYSSGPVPPWVQLRLDAILNGNGDVVLNCYQSALVNPDGSPANPCTSPIWLPIPGFPQSQSPPPNPSVDFYDDVAGINTGSSPLVGGYFGFGSLFGAQNCQAYFDQLTIARQ